MTTGNLVIDVRAARDSLPLNEAVVRVKSPTGPLIYEINLNASESGMTQVLTLEAPELVLSGIPDSVESPYTTYHVEVYSNNFRDTYVNGVQIYPDREAILNIEMLALPLALPSGTGPYFVEITPPAIRNPPEESEGELPPPSPTPSIFTEPFVPEYITVHLGRPTNTSAKNVTVRFPDYIKNVCSSEIYPTWPIEAIKANIYAQISLALNRIFTEWYRSRGYSYDITNSTAYDQYFVPGRNIYDNISIIVNEIFNIYIQKPGRVEPYYAEYCNGTTSTCAGMSQWGSYELANGGANAEQILQNYYGNIELVQTDDIRGTEESYPGIPIKEGSSGEDVRIIQEQLNRIAINYPTIPFVRVDADFGPDTKQAVTKFQKIFSLVQDGIVGKGTWYQISRIYVGVKRLAELTSEGQRPDYAIKEYPGYPLKRGSQGVEVLEIQYYLSIIGQYNENISQVGLDGLYGASTEQAVSNFQKEYVIPADGIVGEVTWNKIIDIYGGIMENVDVPGIGLGYRIYPGKPINYGDSGGNVRYIQRILNKISDEYPQIPKVTEDGEFGSATQRSVLKFQEIFKLNADGIVGKDTWNELNRVYLSIQDGGQPQIRPYPGTPLKLGSCGDDVIYVQHLLNAIRYEYNQIPLLIEDGIFGTTTQQAVIIFQNIFGLAADGIVGKLTWDKLNEVSLSTVGGCIPLRPYPGTALKLGSSGDDVRYIQQLLTTIKIVYPLIPGLYIDGKYGYGTQTSVAIFQSIFGLVGDGIVGKLTWDELNEVYSGICGKVSKSPDNMQNDENENFNFDLPDEKTSGFDQSEVYIETIAPYSNTTPMAHFKILKTGMVDSNIIKLKEKLYELGFLSGNIGLNTPLFGIATKQAVEQFQKENNMEVSGKVNEETWNKLFI